MDNSKFIRGFSVECHINNCLSDFMGCIIYAMDMASYSLVRFLCAFSRGESHILFDQAIVLTFPIPYGRAIRSCSFLRKTLRLL